MISSLPEAREVAHRLVTLVMNKERDVAMREALDMNGYELRVLVLVMADLVRFVHQSWSRSVDMTEEQALDAWRELLLDVAVWSEGIPPL